MGTRPAHSAIHARRSRNGTSCPPRFHKGRRGRVVSKLFGKSTTLTPRRRHGRSLRSMPQLFFFQSRDSPSRPSPTILDPRRWGSGRCRRMDDRAGRVHIRSREAAPRVNRTPPGQSTKPRFQLVFVCGGGLPLAMPTPQGPGEKRGRSCACNGRCSSFAALSPFARNRGMSPFTTFA
jgi:hypothetical protein